MIRSLHHNSPWALIFDPQQLLSLLAKGLTTKQIAEHLHVKQYWVEEALAACRAYFGVSTRSELVAIAARTVAKRRPTMLPQLSSREREVVALVATGIPDKQIARELGVSIGTVRTHLDRIKKKTGLRRRAEIAGAVVGASPDRRISAPRTWLPYLEARHLERTSSLKRTWVVAHSYEQARQIHMSFLATRSGHELRHYG